MIKPEFSSLLALLILIGSALCGCVASSGDGASDSIPAGDYRLVSDSRGAEVKVPADLRSAATVSDGFVEEVMYIFGIDDKISAIGSKGLSSESSYSYPLDDGGNVTIDGGKNIALVISPGLKDLPLFVDYGVAMNYETLASVNPDLVILRLGSSAFLSCGDETSEKAIERIESLGIPLVVLHSPNCCDNSDPTAISDEVRILGDVFGEEERAEEIVSALESRKEMIYMRTCDIPEDERADLLVFGLSPAHRTETSAGISWGLKSTESWILENLIHAGNAFRSDAGGFQVISTEQVLSTDPDAIILATASGYHPPGELYDAAYYRNLRELRAVKEHRVASLPYSPRNAAKRLEYPIDMMVIAKTAYPEYFEDVSLNEWTLDFYQDIYGVDRTVAEKLRSAQLMDWCGEL